ncbi:4'-phosphopantetheinyl transferase family protein [Staphylococcus simulans]
MKVNFEHVDFLYDDEVDILINPNEIVQYRYLNSLNSAEIKVIENIKRDSRKKQFYISRGLLKEALVKRGYYTSDVRNIIISKNDYGKPYIKDLDIHISISHCDNSYVIGVSKCYDIGVDIQKKKKDNKKNTCTNTIIWTLKESFLKAIGIGFMYGLDSIRIKRKGQFYIECSNKLNEYIEKNKVEKVIFNYQVLNEFIVSACKIKKKGCS